jgi:2-succinyl-5-enolpyruvyl-6-hydroxy-3-cyclohexene-1-carboxylate synthase
VPAAPSAVGFHRLIAAFVDELARCGVEHACTSPGSRSAPLVLALAREPRLRAHSHVDERASGFFALGLAKATGRPVVITCTSGTAAANLLPAVIEAGEARVPLVVLTADRPPELRDIGAGQTIDQIKLYGDAVRWFFEVGNHDPTPDGERWMRALACRAVAAATGARPGPVHLNWGLREPLSSSPAPPLTAGRPGNRPWVTVWRPAAAAVELGDLIDGSRRGVIVAGRDDAGLAPALPELAAAAGYPLLADPLSGARRGPAAVAHYDLLLRDPGFAREHAPEVVIRVGDLPTSKPLRTWLAELEDASQILVDRAGGWQDPASVVDTVLRADPRSLRAPAPAEMAWLGDWCAADARAAAAVDATLGDELTELSAARALATALPATATVFVAASMPVRQLESLWPVRDDSPRVLSNRGANGIDGTLATALGIAAAGRGPVVALAGDVAFAHDLGALLAVRRLGLELTVVLLDNGGGAIFDHLPIAAQTDVYERHVATPPGLDAERAAALHGLAYERPATLAQLCDALANPAAVARLVHVACERATSKALHDALIRAARAAITTAPATARPA